MAVSRLRPLQDRHRAVQLAHRRADAGGRALRRAAWQHDGLLERRGARARRAVTARWRHRQGPRHRQGGAARPGGRRARHASIVDSDARSSLAAIAHEQAAARCSARHDDRVRRARRPASSTRAQRCRSTPTACASRAFDARRRGARERVYYSVGGGFVVDEDERGGASRIVRGRHARCPTRSTAATSCSRTAAAHGLLDRRADAARTSRPGAARPRSAPACCASGRAMQACVERGCRSEGMLPGGLKVRAPRARRCTASCCSKPEAALRDPLTVLDWVNLYALAVNEENAAGGRVVTAPTNGAAGIIPAVLHYYARFVPGANDDRRRATSCSPPARSASSTRRTPRSRGAEVGCQGEVGVACSMAAGGAGRGAGRHARAGRERRRDRHGAQPRA